MELPEVIKPETITNTSPTLATVMSKCFLQVAFVKSKCVSYTFPHPKAILGSATHEVFERIYGSEMTGLSASKAVARIRELWNDAVENQRSRMSVESYQDSILKRFGEPSRWSGYGIRRARTVHRALNMWQWSNIKVASEVNALNAYGMTEHWLQAFGGRLRGRPDRIIKREDGVRVVDYKTGSIYDERDGKEGRSVRKDYVDQLLIYAAMYYDLEGVWPVGAILEPLGGSSLEIGINPEEAAQAAQKALDLLTEYNEMVEVGVQVSDFSAKTTEMCGLCSFKAFCERFWDMIEPGDFEDSWRHAQGAVRSIDRLASGYIQLDMEVVSGNIDRGLWRIHFNHPEWFPELGDSEPMESIRLTNLRLNSQARRVLIANIYSELWCSRQME